MRKTILQRNKSKYRKYPYIKLKYIDGVRNTKNIAEFVRRENEVVIIRGQPACPECSSILYRDASIYWHCISCGTIWTAAELITAIESEDKAVRSIVSVRNLID